MVMAMDFVVKFEINVKLLRTYEMVDHNHHHHFGQHNWVDLIWSRNYSMMSIYGMVLLVAVLDVVVYLVMYGDDKLVVSDLAVHPLSVGDYCVMMD
jgi:hypothetical protein